MADLFSVSASLTLDISKYEENVKKARELVKSGFSIPNPEIPTPTQDSKSRFLSFFTDTGSKATKIFTDTGSKATKIFTDTGSKAAETVKASTIAVGNLISDMIKSASAQVTGFIKGTISAGMNFDTAMSQVAATMGKSVDEIQNLRDFAKEMGATTKYSATESAEALNFMALAGYDAETSMKMLPNVMNLASAGAFSLQRASDMLTDTQTAMGLSIERTTQLVDEMAKAASTGNTSVEQLGDAFLTVGGLAKELNGGFVTLSDGTTATVDGVQELEIALTAMANAGVKGSEAGTHMRNMLLKLSAPTEEAKKFFEQYGIEIFNTSGQMKSLRDIFAQMQDTFAGLDQQAKLTAISDIFNARDTASAEALLAAVEQSWDTIGESILDAEGAAARMSKTQLNNLAGAKTMFSSALEGFQIEISDKLSPLLTEFVAWGANAMSRLTRGLKNNGLTGFQQAVKMILNTLTKTIKKNIPNVIKSVTSVIKAILQAISDNAASIIDAGSEISGSIIDGISSTLPEIFKTGGKILTNVINGFAKNAPSLIPQAVDTILTIIDALTNPESNVEMADSGISLLKALGEGIKNSIPIVLEKVHEIIENIKETISNSKDKLKETAGSLLSTFFEFIKEKAEGFDAIGFVQNIVNSISNGASNFSDVMKNIVSFLTENILTSENAQKFLEIGLGLITIISNSIINNISLVVDTATKIIDFLCENILTSENISLVLETGIQILEKIAEALVQNISSLTDAAITIIDFFVDNVLTPENIAMLVETAVKIITEIGTALIQSVSLLIEPVVKIITTIVTELLRPKNITLLLDAASDLLIALVRGIVDNIDEIFIAVETIVRTLIELLTSKQTLEKIVEVGTKILKELFVGIGKIGGQAIAFVHNLINEISNAVKFIITDITTIGESIVEGILSGITGFDFSNFFESFGDSFITGFKDIFAIHSPSKLMKDEIGKNLALGISAGIEENTGRITEQAENAVESLKDIFTTEIKMPTVEMDTQLNTTRNIRDLYSSGEMTYSEPGKSQTALYTAQAQLMQNSSNKTMNAAIGVLEGILEAVKQRQIVIPIDTIDEALASKGNTEMRWGI